MAVATPALEREQPRLVFFHSALSGHCRRVEGFLAQMSGEQINKDFKASGTVYPLAIRLTGKFKTAFPEGKPKEAEKPDEKKDEAKKEEKKPDDSLKETKDETAVVLIGDCDMLYDQFCVSVQNFFGQKFVQPRNGNLNLAQNLVEQMAGDENLISVRSRATLNRPFDPDMSAGQWWLFFGFVIVCFALWAIIMRHITEGLE